MAFSNLFTNLWTVDECSKSPGHPRIQRGRGRGQWNRKRKAPDEWTGPDRKYQQPLTTRTHSELSDADSIDSCGDQAGHKSVCHNGPSPKTKPKWNANKQQKHDKTTKKQQNQPQKKTPHGRGGHHQRSKNPNNKPRVQIQQQRFMTDEFKEQNALQVDGRLVCRHFIVGRCIKGDECQLEHLQTYNDLIKKACKFYIQGFCTKGESCPFMHKSFPCKFFHRKGTCSSGADCKFSHEPLNDVTKPLLDEVIKQHNEYLERLKKEQTSLTETATTEENDDTDAADANKTPDVPAQLFRFSFYNSEGSNADREAEEVSDVVTPDHQQPVCYSVEAVLGPQLSRPFSGLCSTPADQDSSSAPASDGVHDPPGQSVVPYSVDAVLRPRSSLDSSASCLSATSTAAGTPHAVSYTPTAEFEKSAADHREKQSVNSRNEVNNQQEEMFESRTSAETASRQAEPQESAGDVRSHPPDGSRHRCAPTPASALKPRLPSPTSCLRAGGAAKLRIQQLPAPRSSGRTTTGPNKDCRDLAAGRRKPWDRPFTSMFSIAGSFSSDDSPQLTVDSMPKDLQEPEPETEKTRSSSFSSLFAVPPNEVTAPLHEVTAPLREVTAPLREVTSPLREVTAPHEVIAPHEVTSPLREVTVPHEVTSPLREVTVPHEVTAPHEVTSPLREVTSPLREVTSPLREVTAPHEVTSPLREVTVPHEVTAPLRQVTALLCEVKALLRVVKAPFHEVKVPLQEVKALLCEVKVLLHKVAAPHEVAAPLCELTVPLHEVRAPPHEVTAPLVNHSWNHSQTPLNQTQHSQTLLKLETPLRTDVRQLEQDGSTESAEGSTEQQLKPATSFSPHPPRTHQQPPASPSPSSKTTGNTGADQPCLKSSSVLQTLFLRLSPYRQDGEDD